MCFSNLHYLLSYPRYMYLKVVKMPKISVPQQTKYNAFAHTGSMLAILQVSLTVDARSNSFSGASEYHGLPF